MNLRPLKPGSPAPMGAAGTASLNGIRIAEPLCAVFRRKLKSVGLKYTPERAHILDAIIRRDMAVEGGAGVFEADELLNSMRRAGFRVSKATIYRTIKLLAEAGIIQQVLLDSEQSHYQLAYGKRGSGLLINVDTKEIIPIELPEVAEIRDRVCRERGLVPEGHRVVVYARSAAAPVGP